MKNERTNGPAPIRQLELTFDAGPGFRPLVRPPHRSSRADWWFAQMHRVVDAAFDWRPAPPPRPEQVHFPLTLRRARG